MFLFHRPRYESKYEWEDEIYDFYYEREMRMKLHYDNDVWNLLWKAKNDSISYLLVGQPHISKNHHPLYKVNDTL